MTDSRPLVDIHADTINRLAIRIAEAHNHVGPVEYVNVGGAVLGNTVLYGPECDLMGWAIYNNAATSRLVRVTDGADSSIVVVAAFYVATGQASVQWLGPQGVRVRSGLALQLLDSPLIGSLFYRPVRD